MREKKASFCTEADGTPTAENKIKETEREVITMTKNFTPAKADTQRPRLSKEEYAEKKRAEKDGVYQLADEAVKECENIIIRLERENEYHEVENLVRESFWNVYRPVCLEHYVLKETWVSKGRTYMIDNEAHEIVSQFNTEIRGFFFEGLSWPSFSCSCL